MLIKIKNRIGSLRFRVRKKYANRYLNGNGIEIGALNLPLQVPSIAKVSYVDLVSREESIKKFPELNPDSIVPVSIIDNSFEFQKISKNSQNFVIVNHVLEHSPNPLQVLKNWCDVLCNKGILYITVPRIDKCFD